MMRKIETLGKTVEEAVQNALRELGADREDVKIVVLEEPLKGLFGLRNRLAKVEVTHEENPAKAAKRFLEKVLKAMQVKADMEVRNTGEYINIDLRGAHLGILIGRRGETLDALQYLTNVHVSRQCERKIKIILDVEDYRAKREQTLTRLAHRLADEARRSGKNVVLEPMSPHERRVVHTALQGNRTVQTHSEGDEPFRKVVIVPKRSKDN